MQGHNNGGASSSTVSDRIGNLKCWFLCRKENERAQRNPWSKERSEPTTNSTHIWRQLWDSKQGHTGGRRVLLLLQNLRSQNMRIQLQWPETKAWVHGEHENSYWTGTDPGHFELPNFCNSDLKESQSTYMYTHLPWPSCGL